jgi:hypothetical protein
MKHHTTRKQRITNKKTKKRSHTFLKLKSKTPKDIQRVSSAISDALLYKEKRKRMGKVRGKRNAGNTGKKGIGTKLIGLLKLIKKNTMLILRYYDK